MPSQPRPGTSSWWQKLRPDFKAGIIFGVGWSIADIVYIGSAGVGFLFTFPAGIILSLIQGVVVARYASRDSRYAPADYLRLGFLSGLWVELISLAVYILGLMILTGATLGAVLAVLPILLLIYAMTTLIRVGLPALSAWLVGRYGGKSLALRLTGVGCGCATLIAVVILILGVLGFSLLG